MTSSSDSLGADGKLKRGAAERDSFYFRNLTVISNPPSTSIQVTPSAFKAFSKALTVE